MGNRKKATIFAFMLLLLTCCTEQSDLESTPRAVKTSPDIQPVTVTTEALAATPSNGASIPQVAVSPENTKEIATPDVITPSPLATEEASNTPLAPTLTSMPTPLPLSELIWSESIDVIATTNSQQLIWSPVINEFIVDSCAELPFLDPRPDVFIFVAREPDFKIEGLETSEVFCSEYTRFEWRPDGQQILFNALPVSSPLIESGFFDSTLLFAMDRDGTNLHMLSTGGWLFRFDGWMNNSRLIKSSYRGGGNWIVSIYDIDSEEELAWAWIYAHLVQDANAQYVATESGEPCCFMSAAVFSTTLLRPEPEPTPELNQREGVGPYINHLSLVEEPRQLLFNSKFEDWIDASNQMLVLTWNADVNLASVDIIHDTSVTDLQVWDVNSDTLIKVIPGGIWGRISPDRRYLAYLEPSSQSPVLEVLDRNSGTIIFEEAASAEYERFPGAVNAFASFSPNGRFLTFFNANAQLVIYDMENRTIVSTISGSLVTPSWSPDSQRFVFENPSAGLSLFDIQTNRAFPLALSGNDRLASPQWSYDGSFLSVTVLQVDGTWDTVILAIKQ
ncbi:MAG: PD40 domain-containing protein [Anaerolineales bacterium]|nr:PD40 domain-containing protein [Anaerolineales bacterium]MCB8939198.1 PD40 domain-containing protein [Ardenticatenaceae bacterium]